MITPQSDDAWHESRHGEDGNALYNLCRKLEMAIREHHSQKADDRCVEDDDRLYAAAGLPPCDRRVGSKEQMLANCARFIERRCEAGGWKSYAELERELASVKSSVESVECPWPESVWPMTEQEYVKAVPDPELRTAISGFLMRRGWQVAVRQIQERTMR